MPGVIPAGGAGEMPPIDPTLAASGGICTLWAEVDDVRDRVGDASVLLTTITSATRAASEILFALSGRRWSGGGCTAVVRPVGNCIHAAPWWAGYGDGHGYDALTGGMPGTWWSDRASRCPSPPTVRLGAGPVTSVTRVLIDGVVVDPDTYRINEDRHSLIRLADTGGSNPGWPVCQRWDLPSDQAGTFEVQFHYGSAPPEGGRLACISLAAELAKAITPGAQGCRLPGRVSSVTSQGVAVVIDPQTVIKDGLTGLSDVDTWIVAVNPNRLQRRAGVLSPDSPARVRRW